MAQFGFQGPWWLLAVAAVAAGAGAGKALWRVAGPPSRASAATAFVLAIAAVAAALVGFLIVAFHCFTLF